MKMNKLVEEIVRPFLIELNENDNSSNYDGGVPAVKNDDNYPIGKPKPTIDEVVEATVGILSKSTIPSIRNLSTVVDNSTMLNYLNNRPDILRMVSDKLSEPQDSNVDASWEERNKNIADKIGYDVVDWIDNEKNVDVSMGDDDDTFMDVSGVVCEEFSIRQKIRDRVKKKSLNENPEEVHLGVSVIADMLDNDAITFIIGEKFLLASKGEVSHAELIQDVWEMLENPKHKPKSGFPIMIEGSKPSIETSITSANGVVSDVGELQGRFWAKKKILSFWGNEEHVEDNQHLIDFMSKKTGIDFSDYYLDFGGEGTGKQGGEKAAQRHNMNLGAKYLSKDKDDSMKTPEEKHFERMLLRRQIKECVKKILREANVNGSVEGGTRELMPFTNWEGYCHFSKERINSNRDYTIAKNQHIDNDKYIYGNNREENPQQFNVKKETPVYLKLDEVDDAESNKRLWKEYKMGFGDGQVASDGSNYDTLSGGIGSGTNKEADNKTPDKIIKQKEMPKPEQLGYGGLRNYPYSKPSNLTKVSQTPKNKIIDV